MKNHVRLVHKPSTRQIVFVSVPLSQSQDHGIEWGWHILYANYDDVNYQESKKNRTLYQHVPSPLATLLIGLAEAKKQSRTKPTKQNQPNQHKNKT